MYWLALDTKADCGIITFRVAFAELWRAAGGRVDVEDFEFTHEDAAEVATADADPKHEAWIRQQAERMAA